MKRADLHKSHGQDKNNQNRRRVGNLVKGQNICQNQIGDSHHKFFRKEQIIVQVFICGFISAVRMHQNVSGRIIKKKKGRHTSQHQSCINKNEPELLSF